MSSLVYFPMRVMVYVTELGEAPDGIPGGRGYWGMCVLEVASSGIVEHIRVSGDEPEKEVVARLIDAGMAEQGFTGDPPEPVLLAGEKLLAELRPALDALPDHPAKWEPTEGGT